MADQTLLMQTFAALTEALVEEFDLIELLDLLSERSVELFGVSSAGVMLSGPSGGLRLIASSSEAMRDLELFELQADEGPCLDCFRSGRAVENELLRAGGRWPSFTTEALEQGIRSVVALPMRFRADVLGAVNLFSTTGTVLRDGDRVAAQAIADVATIAIVQARAAKEAGDLNEQLAHALSSRVLIEQAKGILAERTGRTIDESFSAIRSYARQHGRRLVDVARGVVDGTVRIPTT